MADDISASIHRLKQRPKTAAERARLYRERQKAAAVPNLPAIITDNVTNVPAKPSAIAEPLRQPERRPLVAPIALTAAALGLAGTGMLVNGWYARSLGSSEISGYLFLAIGLAADLVALSMPATAARLWMSGDRATATAGWLIWSVTFAFAILSSVGFASLNVSDTNMARSSRSVPAVTTANAALNDAMTARDRECVHGVGTFCRQREQTVVDRRAVLDRELTLVANAADPQTVAASHLASWVTRGALAPSGADLEMFRLLLLTLMPQLGGIILLVARRR